MPSAISNSTRMRSNPFHPQGFGQFSTAMLDEPRATEPQLTTLIARRLRHMERKKGSGWIDYHPLSYDVMQATARAYRLLQRIRGQRITLAQALTD